jgi:abequosyltransferase
MILSILIPTYNRSTYLKKNLDLLNKYINQESLHSQIEIVISNNHSSDETNEIISNFQNENQSINLKYYLQTENIGLEKNVLYILNEAEGDYIMYLGDDDFIELNYLIGVINHLKDNQKTHLILPSIVEVNTQDEIVQKGRDHGLDNTVTKAGFKNCLKNSWRGHQLSGLVIKREHLYESYLRNNISNIYPFIYFTAYSCLRGDTFHYTEFPVRVTNPGQQNKDWTYGEDGLIDEIFDNYAKLKVNSIKKTQLQLEVIRKQPWRLWRYKKISDKAFFNVFWNMLFCQNSTVLFKFIFPFEVVKISLKKKIWNLFYSK